MNKAGEQIGLFDNRVPKKEQGEDSLLKRE
jgi:hypothetical protein